MKQCKSMSLKIPLRYTMGKFLNIRGKEKMLKDFQGEEQQILQQDQKQKWN